MSHFEPVDTSQHRESWRIVFAYEDGRVEHKSTDCIKKVAPGSPTPLPDNPTGTWVQLLDVDGNVLFHRTVHAALFPRFAELPLRTGRYAVIDRPSPSGVFEVLLPVMEGGHRVQLMRMPPRPEADATPEPPLLEFELHGIPA